MANQGLAVLKEKLSQPSVLEQFQNALGEKKDLFIASLVDLYTGDKQIQRCNSNDLIGEALKAATMNLPLNKALGYAWVTPFNTKNGTIPQFQIGYKGYIQLAMRTGMYRTINADEVYEGELSSVNKLTGDICLDGEKKSDKVIGYFAYLELLNGFTKTVYMSVEDMAIHAKSFSSQLKYNNNVSVETLKKKAESGITGGQVGWLGNFSAMAKKTCLRRLLDKYGYLSIQMQSAILNESRVISPIEERDVEIVTKANSVVIDTDAEDVTDTEENKKEESAPY